MKGYFFCTCASFESVEWSENCVMEQQLRSVFCVCFVRVCYELEEL